MILGGGSWLGVRGSGDYAAFGFLLVVALVHLSLFVLGIILYASAMHDLDLSSTRGSYALHLHTLALDRGTQCSHVSALLQCGSD